MTADVSSPVTGTVNPLPPALTVPPPSDRLPWHRLIDEHKTLLDIVETPEHVARWFKSEHLPEHLAAFVKQFEDFATDVLAQLGTQDPEVANGMRSLLAAKDAFLRAHIVDLAAEAARALEHA